MRRSWLTHYQDQGNLTLRSCRINRNAKFAVAVFKDSEATVADCDLRDNGLGAYPIEQGATLRRVYNKE